ncbi:MAG: TIGR01459 family HAD-type hydrolase [Mesorhizobium sp.]|uniref:TIGR01459 family HAD-type hydrolase n=2 Tax=Mesorhizobium TaxID=68287 RepID=UPI000F74E3AA|nr:MULTISPECIES: TIGR01459 family HAD-type hydrolase [unclassified Mesorhizobium]RVC64659.1 TIGR01459 family HAD-type hydrolase [Mesorhizobium sp. M00.F.Ca.ET.038.03.1.1]RVC80968.1 TIGR01459 family HAD-type hydrolase [Mesorhizobium sp. M2A.F.Ca.ET.046.02.1.1]AZO36444.1 TIGR01459 family HAD-type hydrolase [Mesorhizobium sp. M2A.F.Ca.ET.046.03.2.1]RWB45018.1 MAG: TIGR01459 family HAD-type hydrolase [Mesorhizobium sp.]RWE07260.1 MAG: TIGR01459 family HAD-type hydrolase [Mesorhizobium sp.]
MSTATTKPVDLRDLADLAGRFDHFVVDQFGVLHDGNAAYPGAVEALSKLKAAGKSVLLLSNSGKRAAPNEDRLVGLGFERGSWDVFVSSGEVAWRRFAGLAGQAGLPHGTRCLLIARDGDRSAVDGLDIVLVDDAGRADVILLSASEGDRFELDHYRKMLAPAAVSGVPCLCTNPDRIMLTKSGQRFGAGRIAELYEELGGNVEWIGKPHRPIYDAALAMLGNPPRERVVGIGDSIEHDIAGASGAGLSSALVRSGILAEMSGQQLNEMFARHDARPDFILPGFVWQV